MCARCGRETADAISVTFAIPPELAPLYAFRAGQYLTLRTTLNGEEVRRSYSICSGADDGELRIAIKQVEGGMFSVWALEALQPGVALEVMMPTGRFGIPALPEGGHVHAGFAAGSGITPLLSIMKTVLSREPDSHFFLFYGSRATADILFRSALEDLKDIHLCRLSVFSRAVPGAAGRGRAERPLGPGEASAAPTPDLGRGWHRCGLCLRPVRDDRCRWGSPRRVGGAACANSCRAVQFRAQRASARAATGAGQCGAVRHGRHHHGRNAV